MRKHISFTAEQIETIIGTCIEILIETDEALRASDLWTMTRIRLIEQNGFEWLVGEREDLSQQIDYHLKTTDLETFKIDNKRFFKF